MECEPFENVKNRLFCRCTLRNQVERLFELVFPNVLHGHLFPLEASQRFGKHRGDKASSDTFCPSDNFFESGKIIRIHELSGLLRTETVLRLKFFGELFWHSGKALPEPFKSVLADLNRWDIGFWIHSSCSRPWPQVDGGPIGVCSPCFFRNSFNCLPSTFYNCSQAVFRIVKTICNDNEPVKFSASKAPRDSLNMT